MSPDFLFSLVSSDVSSFSQQSFDAIGFISLSGLSDKADDDLEMTIVCHRPEGLDQLEAQTNFSKRELQVLYRGFKNVRNWYKEEVLVFYITWFSIC